MDSFALPDGRRIRIRAERWPIAGAFTISRGAKRAAEVVVVEIASAGARGRGECVPYARYGESVRRVAGQISRAVGSLGTGLNRTALAHTLHAGAARNALDCALWDFEAKATGARVHALAGLPPPRPLLSAFTIGLDTPDAMAAKAADAVRDCRLLKLKLGADGDPARLRAIRQAAPDARLIVDANEGWRSGQLQEMLRACAALGVELVEQPLPAGDDLALAEFARPVPVCADESAHTRAGLADLRGRYDAVNIKLDKAGGLSEARVLSAEARRLGFGVMVGCMVATSLAMAPAVLLAQGADWADLDGPLLLARDRVPGLRCSGAVIRPPERGLWG